MWYIRGDLLNLYMVIITINVPVVFMTRDVMILRWEISITRAIVRAEP
jgi:hypothetical protein